MTIEETVKDRIEAFLHKAAMKRKDAAVAEAQAKQLEDDAEDLRLALERAKTL